MDFGVFSVLVLITAWIFGRILTRINLPQVIGMILTGLIIGTWFNDIIPPVLWELEPYIKPVALIVILLRAGIGLKWETLKKAGTSVVLMSFVPCILEGAAVMAAVHYLFDFSWVTSGMTGFIIAAVSPAVVVPSMLDIIEKDGKETSMAPSIILAGASSDDVVAITLFTLFFNLEITGNVNYFKVLLSIPVSLAAGILAGIILGLILLKFFIKNFESIRATEKVILLLCISFLFFKFGEIFNLAALLGIMTTGFLIRQRSEKISSEIAAKMSKIWVLAEIVLFVTIGLQTNLFTVAETGFKGVLVILIGLLFRSAGVWLAVLKSQLSNKERLFCIIAYIPKATVQAALGSLPLSKGIPGGEIILSIAVLSILITAPAGLIGIKLFGKKLLKPGVLDSQ